MINNIDAAYESFLSKKKLKIAQIMDYDEGTFVIEAGDKDEYSFYALSKKDGKIYTFYPNSDLDTFMKRLNTATVYEELF